MTTEAYIPQKQIGVGGFELREPERRYLQEVIESSRLSYGPMSHRFETQFAARHQCAHAVFCNSGTSALHIAVAALKEKHGWEDGREVIVPAVTFVATANVILHNDLKPVFADVESDTYNIDPDGLGDLITEKTCAILPVHLFGQAASMERILEMAKKNSLAVIEDSAETMFATYQGRSVGSMGDIGCFSTYVAHMLVTGVGGFATTNDPDLAVMLRSIMNHGRDSIYLNIDDDQGKTVGELEEVVNRRFKFVRPGHSFRCTELEAAIGVGQMEQADGFLARRREIAARYTQELSDLEEVLQLPHAREDRTHSFMMYPIVLRDESKWDLVQHLEGRMIETREMMPLINQPVYQTLLGDIEDQFPVTKRINRSGFYIGCHPYLSDKEVDYTITQIRAYFSA